MNKGYYWAGDAIATNLGRIADNDRANRAMREQQSFHCGDLAIQRAALAELERLDPQNVMFKPCVQDEIYRLAEVEFKRRGWDKGSSFTVDPAAVYSNLLVDFEKRRESAIAAAKAEPVKHRRRGWPWARRDDFSWRRQVTATEHDALALQAAEIVRLVGAGFGNEL